MIPETDRLSILSFEEIISIQILVVEDNQADTNLINWLLTRENFTHNRFGKYRLTFAKDLKTGLDLLNNQSFNLILLDLLLPDSQGLTTFHQIRKHVPQIPIIILSAFDDTTIALQAVRNGAQDYLIKGKVDENILARSIHYAIERKHYKETLKISEERYKGVTQSVNDAIIILDTEGTIITWNIGATTIFGFEESNIIGHAITDIIPDMDRDIYAKLFQKSNDSGPSPIVNKTIEATGIKQNGKTIPIELSIVSWEASNGRFFTAIIRNISRRKRLEDQYRHAQKMEAVGQLAGGIAHDFNNILTGIIGFAELAADTIDADLPAQEYIRSIIRKSDNAATLVRQILAFSRKQILDTKRVDMNDSVLSVSNFIVRVIGEHIEFSTNLADNLYYINADPIALEQIITNLCVNARDAMSAGGKLTIETSNITVSASNKQLIDFLNPGKYAVLSLIDSGHGIDSETFQHIYEPFYTTKEVGHGSGLGLAMVYGLVKQHQAYIHCDSTLGERTTFQIYFPATDVSPDTENRVVVDHVVGGTETILIVEDEVDLIVVTKSILNQYGYTVLTAGNGIDGYQAYQQNRDKIKLVLTDIVMPKEGGIELYKRVYADNPEIKFLFITGYASGLADKEMVIGKEIDVLSKPYRGNQLAKKIRHILDL
ncbi:MAG: response regulator [Candidatus Marinimicrobia bacterium]|nr:response regulator [Candidatus Neomarinimicrobiota bacterium]